MEFLEVIKKRRSIRKFQEKEITDEQIATILQSAVLAPTAGNLQPWLFLVVKNKQLKEKISHAALNQKFIISAPVVIVVCADLDKTKPYGQRGEKLFAIQDTAAATQNIILTATSLGLNTCWVGAFYEEEMAEIFGLGDEIRPVAVVVIGYGAIEARDLPKRSLEEVVRFYS